MISKQIFPFKVVAFASAINCYKGDGAFGFNHLDNVTCPTGIKMCKNTTYGKFPLIIINKIILNVF